MFISSIINGDLNYPKYMIIPILTMYKGCTFYYIVSQSINSFSSNIMPFYIVTLLLHSTLYLQNKKVDISKLGTDYLATFIGLYYRSECKGEYPDNYIFVNEASWPSTFTDRIDRTPLKRSQCSY